MSLTPQLPNDDNGDDDQDDNWDEDDQKEAIHRSIDDTVCADR